MVSALMAIDASDDRIAQAWTVLAGVPDPELPALSIGDLGIVRDVRLNPRLNPQLEVVLTPTYSGCPATEVIEQQVRDAFAAAGVEDVAVTWQRAPAWTTDWISDEGRRKLKAYGIAPPGAAPTGSVPIRIVRRALPDAVSCPRCDSVDTERLSAFGSTACKSLYRCRACREPFESFKAI